jgi:single-stranded DNA-binding protein
MNRSSHRERSMPCNQALGAGIVTAPSAFRILPSEQPVCSSRSATHCAWTDKASQEQAEVHTVVGLGKQGECIHPYVRKGSLPRVRERLHTRHWANTKNPELKDYRTESIAETVELRSNLFNRRRSRSALPRTPA